MSERGIYLHQVSKAYKTQAGWHQVLKDVSLQIKSDDKIGVVGRNGAGKSTLLRIIGGSELPTTGLVERNDMTVSWPVGFSGHVQANLSGRSNIKFCARIYGRPIAEVVDFVQDFSQLGHFLDEPVKTYSTGMKARLGFALSMAIEFDCLLIDEVTAVGDPVFRKKCDDALSSLRNDRAFILINHGLNTINKLCTKIVVLGFGDQPFISTKVHPTIKAYEKAIMGNGWTPPETL